MRPLAAVRSSVRTRFGTAVTYATSNSVFSTATSAVSTYSSQIWGPATHQTSGTAPSRTARTRSQTIMKPAAVSAVHHVPGEHPRADGGGAGDDRDQAHLDDGPGGVEDEQREREQRDGPAEHGQRLAEPEDVEVLVPPERRAHMAGSGFR